MKNVFSKKNNKVDCVVNGEFKFIDILNKNNIKYTSLSHKYSTITSVPNRFDRNTNSRLNDIVFMKVNWRSGYSHRDSLPVRSTEIYNLINKKSNFEEFSNYLIDYNNIQCPNVGKHDHQPRYLWNTKQRFYNLYGNAEEFITFPLRTNILTVGIALYSHYSNNNMLPNYCIEGIKCLIQLGFKVVILTNCNNFCNITYIPCEKYIVKGATNDYFMIKKYLNENSIDNYKYLLLVNDSIAFPIRDLNQVKSTFNIQRSKSDFWGLWTSPEYKKHLISSFMEFSNKKNLIQDLKNYLNKFSLCTKQEAWFKMEVNLTNTLNSLGYKSSAVVEYESLTGLTNKMCPIFHPEVFPQWITRPEVFAIKLKYLGNYLNKEKLNCPYLNYLLRFWHFDHTGPKGEPEKQNVYKGPIAFLH